MEQYCFEQKLNQAVHLLSGQTAESIKKHEEFVMSLWDELKRKTSRKKCKLQDSSDFHKLNNEVGTYSLL